MSFQSKVSLGAVNERGRKPWLHQSCWGLKEFSFLKHTWQGFFPYLCCSWIQKPVTKPDNSKGFCVPCPSLLLSIYPASEVILSTEHSLSAYQKANTKIDSAAPRMSPFCYPITGPHQSRQKASSWLQLDACWAPQPNFERAEHPQLVQNQWGLQALLKNNLLTTFSTWQCVPAFCLFLFLYFSLILSYLEIAPIATIFFPLFVL